MRWKVGDSASLSRRVTEEDLVAFAEISRDGNPVHLDPEYAARTRFGRPIAHGMLAASLISAVLGTELPGPGTIYLSQKLEFRTPVYPGDEITAEVEVTEIAADKPILTLRTRCRNQDAVLVLEGEAVVLFEPPE